MSLLTSGGPLKYVEIESSIWHNFGFLDSGVVTEATGTRRFLLALDRYNSVVSMALQSFFIRPSLKVDIQPRSSPITSVERLIPQLAADYDTPFEYIGQSLMVTGKKTTIHSLTANVWLNGAGPYAFSWSRLLRTLDPLLGPEPWPFLAGPSHLSLLPDETTHLPIWAARRTKTGEVYLTLNTHPPKTSRLTELEQPFINIDVQFIAENYTAKKSLKYYLNAKSWDELGLTERS